MIGNNFHLPITYQLERNINNALKKSHYVVLPGKSSSLGLSGEFDYFSLWIGKVDDCHDMLINRHMPNQNQKINLTVDNEGMFILGDIQSNPIQTIFVNKINGRKIHIQMHKKQTIAQAKVKCFQSSGFPPNQFCLMKRSGKILSVTLTIE